MPSLQAKIVHKILKLQAYGWAKGPVPEQRARQEKLTGFIKIPSGVTVTPFNMNGISAELLDSEGAKDGVVLYLHGGAYALGSVNVHREFLSRLAKTCRAGVLAINYRLAPEHPYPAALEDALTAFNWLITQGYDPAKIVIAGDSAGGGLTIATLVSLRDQGQLLPACAVCISPWVDLFSAYEKDEKVDDPILNAEILGMYTRYYTGEHNPKNPLISPIFADLRGLPPLLIHAGTNEILLNQIKDFYDKARQADIDITLETWPGLFHVFQITPFLPESKLSLDKIADFVAEKLNKAA